MKWLASVTYPLAILSAIYWPTDLYMVEYMYKLLCKLLYITRLESKQEERDNYYSYIATVWRAYQISMKDQCSKYEE